jgi:nucleoside-diphosphate-sugar epimerase
VSQAETPRRRVVVTGAGGFIGSHLAADQLRRGREVVALDLSLERLEPLGEAPGLERVEADLADRTALERALRGADIVFHLAAAHLSVAAADEEFRRVNVEALRGLADACLSAGVRRLVHASSVGVYGEIREPPADETSACHPEVAYEVTKLEGERLLLDLWREKALPVVILRPAWVYGPGCPRTEKLFRSVAAGRFPLASGRDAQRHCLYIRDAVDAFERAAWSDAALGRVIVIGDARASTVGEVVERIADLTGGRRPLRLPLPVLRAAALAAELAFRPTGREPPLSRRSLKFYTQNTAFRTDLARDLLGFTACYELGTGLQETWSILCAGNFWRVPLPEPSRA